MPKQLIKLKSTGIKGDCLLVTDETSGYLMMMTTGGKWKWTNSSPGVFVTICPWTPGAGHSRSSTHHWQGSGVSKILGVHITDDLTLTANTTLRCQDGTVAPALPVMNERIKPAHCCPQCSPTESILTSRTSVWKPRLITDQRSLQRAVRDPLLEQSHQTNQRLHSPCTWTVYPSARRSIHALSHHKHKDWVHDATVFIMSSSIIYYVYCVYLFIYIYILIIWHIEVLSLCNSDI